MGKEEGDGAGVGGWLFGKGVGGPLLFGEVGSQAKDLVYKGFVAGHMLMISCLGPVGSTLTSTASITQDITVGIVSASFQDGNTKHDLSFDTAGSQINASTTYTNFGVPGVTAGVQTSFPGGVNEGKAHVHYHHDFAALGVKVHGLKVAPEVELSANIGSQKLYVGGSVLYNTQLRTIGVTKAGFGFTTPEFTAAAIVDPLIDKSIDVYVTRFLSPKCQVGAHINRLQDKGLTAAKVAGSYIWDKHTIVKARFDDKGIVAGLLQYSPNPLITFSLFAELNSRDLKAHPNVGLSLSLLAGAAS
ncbi:hypothetical protein CY35_06G025000 [Sphagnum magellanicum]|nr:hypothetical protein CY35_06G025000 [Sphagnum magellanicum]KAH9558779.1 hypothetical protein CY35_06G025000 [Sphagnum magellanicum]KAH9558780.1 hypothetical protein CY35_06G025000 [Sphagnum magellanicum]